MPQRITLTIRIALILGGSIGARAVGAPAADSRLPMPPDDARRKSVAELQKLFKAEYADTSPDARRSLAGKLFKQAENSSDDPTARFVFLRESRDLFAKCGDARDAVDAGRKIEDLYQVAGATTELEALTSARSASRGPDAAIEFGYAALAVAETALRDNNIPDAAKAIKEAETANIQATSPLGLRILAMSRRVHAAQGAAVELDQALRKLRTAPTDPHADLVAGREYCFDYGNWEMGLPFLAKCGDAKVAQVATAEAGHPETMADTVALADAWWNLPESSGIDHARSHARAAFWYRRVLDGAQGLQRTLAERRIAEADASGGSPALDLLALVNPRASAVNGTWRLNADGLVSGAEQFGRVEIPYRPPAEYDFRIVFARQSGNRMIDQLCRIGDTSFTWELEYDGTCGAIGQLAGPDVSGEVLRSEPIAIQNAHRYTSIVSVRKNRIAAYLDGKLLLSFDPQKYQISFYSGWTLNHPEYLGIGEVDSTILFYSVEVTEVGGRGTILR